MKRSALSQRFRARMRCVRWEQAEIIREAFASGADAQDVVGALTQIAIREAIGTFQDLGELPRAGEDVAHWLAQHGKHQ